MKKLKQLFLILALICISKPIIAGDTLIVSPNPFDSIAVIQFNIAYNDTIWLNVNNILGNSVKTFYNGTVLPSGSYSLNLYGDSLPNGIYIVVLKINSTKTLSKKLINIGNAIGLKEDENNKPHILLYPNPTTSMLEIPIDGLKTIIVTDLNGKILINTTSETKSISLFDLAVGNYIITILSEKKQLLATQQIFKIN